MLKTQDLSSSQSSEAAKPQLDKSSSSQPEREKVRILVYGSRKAIEDTIKQLQLLRYVEHFRWTPIQQIPDTGIHITPTEAEAYSLLVRQLSIE